MKAIKEKHSLAMRWCHWVNFPILTVMIWSGMLIYWANDEYSITVFGHTYFRFFPDWFYNALTIPHRLSEGMAFHFLFMWFFTLNGILYVLYTIISGDWREMVPKKNSFKEAWLVLLHDLHIRKTAPPQNKYNAAQRIAYTAIIFMGIGSVITGLAIYKPVQFYYLTWLSGGYHFARILHFALTLGYVFFFLVHVFQVIMAGWSNFRSVISGFDVINIEQVPAIQLAYANEETVTAVQLQTAFEDTEPAAHVDTPTEITAPLAQSEIVDKEVATTVPPDTTSEVAASLVHPEVATDEPAATAEPEAAIEEPKSASEAGIVNEQPIPPSKTENNDENAG